MNELITIITGRQGLPVVQTRGERMVSGVQILHVTLWYANNTTGEINLTSPHNQCSDDIENQWSFLRSYLKASCQQLGIVKYQANIAVAQEDGSLEIVLSGFPFDLLSGKAIRP